MMREPADINPPARPRRDGPLRTLGARFAEIARSRYALAAAFVFFANGFILSNWFMRLPAVQDALALDEGTLGLALLFFAVGGVVAMPIGGALTARFGSGRISTISGIGLALAIVLPGFAQSLPALAAGLVIAGAMNGMMDVSMNAQADAAETRIGFRIMSFCHAMFSLGFGTGALPAGAFASCGIDPGFHLLVIAVPAALVLLGLARFQVADRPVDGPAQPLFALPRGPLMFFGLICLCGAVIEGAMYDWIAVYMENIRARPPLDAAAAYGVFASAMFIARLLGDLVTERIGAARAVRYGLVLAAAGLVVALAAPVPVHLLGLAAVGFGVAGVFPAVFRAAGNLPGRAPGPSMAAAVTLGYTGFLFGPPMIGFVADASNLGYALAGLIPLCLIGAALAGTLRMSEPQTAASSAKASARSE